MDFDLLRTFVAVADCGGFTRAEAVVHRTQSTISQQIARLEQHVGRPLLVRNTRQVTLTEYGEQYLGYARKILAMEEEARLAVRSSPMAGEIRLGIPEELASEGLPLVLERFSAACGKVRLELFSTTGAELRAMMRQGQLDLAVLKEEAPSTDALLCWPEELYWTARHDLMLRQRASVPLITYAQGCPFRKKAIEALDAAGIGWHIALESPNWSGIKAAVEGGLGVALLPRVRRPVAAMHLTVSAGLPPVTPIYMALQGHVPSERSPQAALVRALALLMPAESAAPAMAAVEPASARWAGEAYAALAAAPGPTPATMAPGPRPGPPFRRVIGNGAD